MKRYGSQDSDSIVELTLGQAGGNAFVIPTPTNRHILVSSEEDIKELSQAPVDQLSLHAVAKEVRPPERREAQDRTARLRTLDAAAEIHDAWFRMERPTGR